MVIRWGVFSAKSRTALKTGWLVTARVVALYLGVIQPRDQARGIASEKAAGLAAAVSGGAVWEPVSLWRQTSILPHFRSEAYLQKGIVGRVSVDRAVVAPASLMTFSGGHTGGEEVGFGQHFRLSYKMLSKFAHPTAMRILAPPDETRNAIQRDCFFSQGCLYFRGAFDSLESPLAGAA